MSRMDLLTLKQVAEHCGLTYRRFHYLTKTHQIPQASIHVGHSRLYTEDDVRRIRLALMQMIFGGRGFPRRSGSHLKDVPEY